MKVAIFNDTSRYHKGCEKVMEYLHNDIWSCGHEITESVQGNKDRVGEVDSIIADADAVVVNGEGTMHHDRPVPHQLLFTLKKAKKAGKRTALINTVWQSMTVDDEMKDVLRDTYISVREVMSHDALLKDGIESDIHLDLSYFVDVPVVDGLPQKELVIGKFFQQKDYRPEDIPHMDIFHTEWNDYVNTLRNTDWFVTGRHHELYAACKARCKFAALSGNTWKNEGLMKTAGVNIPIEAPHLLHSRIPEFLEKCKKKKKEYDKLFDWMEAQPKFTLADKL